MKKMIINSLIFICFLFIPSCLCNAQAENKKVQSFQEWYETYKDIDGSNYELQEMIFLSDTVLDGNGQVTISCGEFGILVADRLSIDNPNLTITGNGDFILLANTNKSDLQLKRGNLNVEGNGKAVVVTDGKISGAFEKTEKFYIHAYGPEANAIYLSTTETCLLDGFDITVEGNGNTKGIYSYYSNDVTVQNCNIMVTGIGNVHGIQTKGVLAVKDSSVTAVSDQDGYAFSVTGLSLSIDNSVLVPQLMSIGRKEYVVQGYDSIIPIICNSNEDVTSNLPDKIWASVKDKKTGSVSRQELPICWDKEAGTAEGNAYRLFEGRLDTSKLMGIYDTEEGVVPKVTVFVEENGKMPLLSYQIMDKTEFGTKIQLLMPFPYEASALYLEYSTDGRNFTRYSSNGYSNLLIEGTTPNQNWLYGISFFLPVTNEKMYLKIIMKGGMFEGESNLLEIDRSSEQIIPPGISGSTDGDRGGQTIKPGDNSGIDYSDKQQETKKIVNTYGVGGKKVEDKTQEEWAKRNQEAQEDMVNGDENSEVTGNAKDTETYSQTAPKEDNMKKRYQNVYVGIGGTILLVAVIVCGICFKIKKRKNVV